MRRAGHHQYRLTVGGVAGTVNRTKGIPMSQATIMKKTQFCAAVTAMGASGLLTVAVPAQADPMFPLAPPCVQYGWAGNTVLQHTNGWTATFNATGTSSSQPASATHTGGGRLAGTVDAVINGRSVSLLMKWNNGAVGNYTGTVGDDGIARGDTVDLVHPENKAGWNTASPLSCLKTEAPPPVVAPPDKPPVVAPPPPVATVPLDTDVYDAPDGVGNKIGTLQGGEGQTVELFGVGCRADQWCNIVWPGRADGAWTFFGPQ